MIHFIEPDEVMSPRRGLFFVRWEGKLQELHLVLHVTAGSRREVNDRWNLMRYWARPRYWVRLAWYRKGWLQRRLELAYGRDFLHVR